MVTMEQLKSGLCAYIDTEILPRMEGYKRYGLMVYMGLLMDNFSNKITDLMHTPAMSALGIFDDKGQIDIDRLHDVAYDAMKDNLDLSIPVVGRFIFSRSDVDKLCELIRRA